ncbi:MAG: hypothetical protein E7Z91_00420 [Cyanobacteria bacterium SIG30]|nr:hypothetical protein [Cyanobacteria bacterium SIG30]
MKRLFKYIFLILIITFIFDIKASAQDVIIPSGSIIQVYPNKVISTLINQEGDYVSFVNQSDMWVGEINAIPKNTVFKGHINFLKMPIKGVNGALSFVIDSMVFPDRTIQEVNAVVQYKGQNVIGGDLTPPASYNYTIHSQKPIGWFGGIKGVLQYVPSGEYEQGQHMSVGPKDMLYIIFNEDVELSL